MTDIKFITSIVDNINVYYFENFIDQETSDKFLDLLEDKMIYNSEEDSKVFVFGKYHKIPRKHVGYGDPGTKYKFSGTTVNAKSWNNNDDICMYLKLFKKKVESLTNQKFNFVLINRYKDGYDSIGPHCDDEKDLGKTPNIVGLSFGTARKIVFESKQDTILYPKSIPLVLKHGSLYIMNHPTNNYWKHSIPKDPKVKNVRISLTFRYMI